jgi:hypothetical protein
MSSEAAYFQDAMASTPETLGLGHSAPEIPTELLDEAQSPSDLPFPNVGTVIQTSDGIKFEVFWTTILAGLVRCSLPPYSHSTTDADSSHLKFAQSLDISQGMALISLLRDFPLDFCEERTKQLFRVRMRLTADYEVDASVFYAAPFASAGNCRCFERATA